jgi:hypothetical protein
MIPAPLDLDNLCGGFFDFALFDQFAILRNCKDFDYDLFNVTPSLGMVKRDHYALAARCIEPGPAEHGLDGQPNQTDKQYGRPGNCTSLAYG